MPLLHGAQGCATYIRRYLISHFRDPADVASSALKEAETVFGGETNLGRALDNLVRQYSPEVVTVFTTCLAETIGEDVPLIVRRYREQRGAALPVVCASTPSYRDGHVEGFHAMTHAIVGELATEAGSQLHAVNVLPPLLSPADLRHLRELVTAFGLAIILLPDFADRLDGVVVDRYPALASGGTSLAEVRAMSRARATLDFTLTGRAPRSSSVLAERGVSVRALPLPIGVRATDELVHALAEIGEQRIPPWLEAERGRLLDAYADGHKVVFGRRVVVFGDPELTVGIAGLLAEIGARPVVVATGARNRALPAAVATLPDGLVEEVLDDTDFTRIEEAARRTGAELLIGSSKGYRAARALGIPLLRVGFPIHDRIGAARLLHVGYRGTLCLFDAIVNLFLEKQQESSSVGFSYL